MGIARLSKWPRISLDGINFEIDLPAFSSTLFLLTIILDMIHSRKINRQTKTVWWRDVMSLATVSLIEKGTRIYTEHWKAKNKQIKKEKKTTLKFGMYGTLLRVQ